MCKCESERTYLHGIIAARNGEIRDLRAKLAAAERALTREREVSNAANEIALHVGEVQRRLARAVEVVRWVGSNYQSTLAGKSVRDADECLDALAAVLAENGARTIPDPPPMRPGGCGVTTAGPIPAGTPPGRPAPPPRKP